MQERHAPRGMLSPPGPRRVHSAPDADAEPRRLWDTSTTGRTPVVHGRGAKQKRPYALPVRKLFGARAPRDLRCLSAAGRRTVHRLRARGPPHSARVPSHAESRHCDLTLILPPLQHRTCATESALIFFLSNSRFSSPANYAYFSYIFFVFLHSDFHRTFSIPCIFFFLRGKS